MDIKEDCAQSTPHFCQFLVRYIFLTEEYSVTSVLLYNSPFAISLSFVVTYTSRQSIESYRVDATQIRVLSGTATWQVNLLSLSNLDKRCYDTRSIFRIIRN